MAQWQSSLWAAKNGDVKAMMAGVTGEMRKFMEDEFKDKPEIEASVRASDQVMGLKSVRILNRELQSDDTTLLTVAFEGRADTETGKIVVKKIGNEWKLSEPLE